MPLSEEPQNQFSRCLSIICGARCPQCKLLCSYRLLKKTAPGRSFYKPLDGITCRNCRTVYRLGRGFWIGVLLFVGFLFSFVFTAFGMLALFVWIDGGPGGLFFNENGNGNFLAWLTTGISLVVIVTVLDARIRRITIVPAGDGG